MIYVGCTHQPDAGAPARMAKDGRAKPMARNRHGKVRYHVSHLYHRPHMGVQKWWGVGTNKYEEAIGSP